MSSGFEVRSLSANRLKRMKGPEDEEIFTIQVGYYIVINAVHPFQFYGLFVVEKKIAKQQNHL